MGGTGLSGGAHVRFILLRRHVLDDLVSVRGPVEDGAGLGCGRLRPVYQRLQRPVRLRRPCGLRHPVGQVGSAHHRFHIRRDDGGGRAARAARHHRRLCPGEIPPPGICWLHVLRAWQRDRGHGRDALDREVVPGRAHGPGHGTSARDSAPGHGRGARALAAPGGGERRPRVQPLRDGPAGRLRPRPDGRRPHPVGDFRGAGCKDLSCQGRNRGKRFRSVR